MVAWRNLLPREQRFLSIDALSNLPRPAWAIEGLFEVNSLVMLAGPPASYKSFLGLSWILSMASGRKWNDTNTIKAKVLYVLGEGKSSLLKRIDAWTTFNKLTDSEKETLNDNFRVSFEVPQLAMKSSVDNMLAQLEQEDYKPSVLVIDTFARSFVGLDENSQKDTGLWIESADRLRQLGYTVIFLHHTNKNTEFGFRFRGSSAIEGAMDTSFIMHRESGGSKLKFFCTKQKDHDEGAPMYFQRHAVRPDGAGRSEEGSVVLVTAPLTIDERYTPEGQAIEATISALIQDPTFESDRARARELASKFPNLTDAAAQTRVSKARKGVKPENDGSIH